MEEVCISGPAMNTDSIIVLLKSQQFVSRPTPKVEYVAQALSVLIANDLKQYMVINVVVNLVKE